LEEAKGRRELEARARAEARIVCTAAISVAFVCIRPLSDENRRVYRF
jgi:hypothetical protein